MNMNAGGYNNIYYEVQDLINQQRTLEEYIQFATQCNRAIDDCLDEINDYWYDTQFMKFNGYVGEIIEEINDRINGLVQANNKLEQYIAELLSTL
jgi:prefoldin subunit 5